MKYVVMRAGKSQGKGDRYTTHIARIETFVLNLCIHALFSHVVSRDQSLFRKQHCKRFVFSQKTCCSFIYRFSSSEDRRTLFDPYSSCTILCMFSPLSFGRRGRPDDATGPDLGWFHPFRDFVRKKDHQGFTARDLALQVRVTYDNSPRHVISKKTRNHDLLVMIWCDQRQRILYQFLEFGCAPCAHTRFAVSPLFLDALALSTSVDGLLFSSYFGRLGMTKLASY